MTLDREKLFGVKLAFRKGQFTGLVVLVLEKEEKNIYFVDPKSNFSLFLRWSHNFSYSDFPITKLQSSLNKTLKLRINVL